MVAPEFKQLKQIETMRVRVLKRLKDTYYASGAKPSDLNDLAPLDELIEMNKAGLIEGRGQWPDRVIVISEGGLRKLR